MDSVKLVGLLVSCIELNLQLVSSYCNRKGPESCLASLPRIIPVAFRILSWFFSVSMPEFYLNSSKMCPHNPPPSTPLSSAVST